MSEKPYNNGTWTQGRFDSFIKGLIRAGLKKWGPKHECIRNARIRRGWYLCAGCEEEVPTSTTRELKTRPGEIKRVKNIYADHIEPIVDPAVGRTSWDEVIQRAFVDTDGYQALCFLCHEEKTASERAVAKERNKK
tara:strand:+ start:17333 stop:17740 length:408 start_codon:yes stop_codon:yes gene_type:complete